MLDLIPFKQSDDSRCGPTAVRMVLSYYGIDATEDEIAARCGWTYELGCDDKGMKQALESYELGVQIWNGAKLEDIKYFIQHRIPVIIDWFSAGASNDPETGNGHSSVVVGYDRNKVHLLDPFDGRIKAFTHEDFVRLWFDWRAPVITSWSDMVIRQLIIAYPKRLTEAFL